MHHISQEHIQTFGRNDKSSRCEDWLLRRYHERDQLYQSDNLSKSQNQCGTSKNKSSEQEFSRKNNWCIWKDQEKLQQDRYEDLSKSHNQSGTSKNKSSDQEFSRCNNWCIRREQEKLQRNRSDDFSKTQNHRGTSKNKGSDHESSRYNKWHFRRDHENYHLDRSDNISKSQNWCDRNTIESSGQETSRYNNWRLRRDHEGIIWTALIMSPTHRNGESQRKMKSLKKRYNNWRFRKDHETDQQNRFDRLSNSQDLRDSRTNRKSGRSNSTANGEWRNHTFKRLEDMSGYKNWQATTERKQLGQKTLNLDSEEQHVRPNHNKCY